MTFARILALVALALPAADAAARACAHRGDQEVSPENTVPALQSAARKGARQIEFDVKFTRDRRLVLLHDPTLDRTTSGKGRLAEFDFDPVRALDAGRWFSAAFAGTRVPTFEEALAAIPPGVLLNVHLADSSGLVLQVARRLDQLGRARDAFLACSERQAAEVRAVYPALRICNMSRQGGDVEKYVERTIAMGAQFIQLVDAAGGKLPEKLAEHCRRLHSHGVTVNYFGAQEEEKIRALAAAGVDYVLTDRLSLCRRVLGE
jgi:glycerophosphoryl diester phosphodiesterase